MTDQTPPRVNLSAAPAKATRDLSEVHPTLAKLLANNRTMHVRNDVTGCTILLMPGNPDKVLPVGIQRTAATFEEAFGQVVQGFDLLADPAEGSR